VESPLKAHTVERDGRIVRLTAAAFVKRFKVGLKVVSKAIAAAEEARRLYVDTLTANRDVLYRRDVARWLTEAKRVNRWHRQELAKELRQNRYNLFRSRKSILKHFKNVARERYLVRTVDEAIKQLDHLSSRSFQVQYASAWNTHRVDWRPRQLTRGDFEARLGWTGTVPCWTETASGLPAERLERYETAQGLLRVAEDETKGVMFYLPVSLMEFLINLDSYLLQPLLKMIERLETEMRELGTEANILARFSPDPTHFALSSPTGDV
jgi:hypothetical protein